MRLGNDFFAMLGFAAKARALAFGAGAVESGISDMAGFGRMAFAYPDFARDTLYGAGFDGKKTCIACGKCSELMRMGKVAGCVIRDSDLYLPIYKA